MEKEVNNRICCNVKNCIFNEQGKDCNLDKVTISKGNGENHFCKSFISLNENNVEENKKNTQQNYIESADEYFDYGEILDDIQDDIEKIEIQD